MVDGGGRGGKAPDLGLDRPDRHNVRQAGSGVCQFIDAAYRLRQTWLGDPKAEAVLRACILDRTVELITIFWRNVEERFAAIGGQLTTQLDMLKDLTRQCAAVGCAVTGTHPWSRLAHADGVSIGERRVVNLMLVPEVSWLRRPPSSASLILARPLKAGGACSNHAGCP
jgi:hypothetical protein